jgi:CDP-6-deoxy-D-xylo-4-hexulose-3-dehydrase
MIPNLLGNIADWEKISYIGRKYNLKIIEDSADTIGYSYNNNNTGKFSDIVTNSFYASHVITGAGFGGIVCFNDKHLYERAKILRGWGRSSATFNENEDIKIRFSKKINNIPYDGKYIFMEMGYNFLPSEISAAFALQQLKKLKTNIKIRVRNFAYLINFFKKYSNFFRVPLQGNKIVTPWLAFPLTIKTQEKFSRNELQIFLERKKIQTRVIFSGNILRQPVMKNRLYKKHKESSVNSDDVMKNGILIGCHNGLNLYHLKYICNNFYKFLKIKKIN